MELNRIEGWITGKLRNDATLMALVEGVHAWPAPQSAAFPYIVFEFQPGSEDVNGVGGRRILVSAQYLVRVIGRECGIEDLKTAADRMDALLSGGIVPSSTGVQSCYREQPFSMIEVDEGLRYPHLGGLYRILAN